MPKKMILPDNFAKFCDFYKKSKDSFADLELINSELKANKQISLFARTGDGSLIGFWNLNKDNSLENCPIIWIDSEGEPNVSFPEIGPNIIRQKL